MFLLYGGNFLVAKPCALGCATEEQQHRELFEEQATR